MELILTADKKPTQTRRTFLNNITRRLPMAGVAAVFHRRALPFQDPQAEVITTVKLADSPELGEAGGFVLVKGTSAGDILIVCTGDGQYAAMSNKCPHRQCEVEVKNPTLIQCPCHRSAYKIDGTYVSGPAKRSLKQFRVAVEEGVITVIQN